MSSSHIEAGTVRDACAGDPAAVCQIRAAGDQARALLRDDPGPIVVTRFHALQVLRALVTDPDSAPAALTWATLVRTGMDGPGVQPLDIEIDVGCEVPVIDALRALDYLDDGPLSSEVLQELIGRLERPAGDAPSPPTASGGHSQAMTNLGVVAQVAGDIDGARDWYHRAADAGYPGAMHNLGLLAQEAGDIDGARDWYHRASDAGYPGAMRNLVDAEFVVAVAEVLHERVTPDHRQHG